eukprot:Pompholyxophrys_sp_v1_NODE_32_length_3580_cov_3.984118.p2 type:complete len:102 gc:universal NODE_32_length_3580_cov_3.984118:973-1278(+)
MFREEGEISGWRKIFQELPMATFCSSNNIRVDSVCIFRQELMYHFKRSTAGFTKGEPGSTLIKAKGSCISKRSYSLPESGGSSNIPFLKTRMCGKQGTFAK